MTVLFYKKNRNRRFIWPHRSVFHINTPADTFGTRWRHWTHIHVGICIIMCINYGHWSHFCTPRGPATSVLVHRFIYMRCMFTGDATASACRCSAQVAVIVLFNVRTIYFSLSTRWCLLFTVTVCWHSHCPQACYLYIFKVQVVRATVQPLIRAGHS